MLAPYDVLLTTCNHIVPHVLRQSKTLTPFQEFVIVLIKLRLNVPLQDLLYRIKIGSEDQSDGRAVWAINRMAREREEL